MPNARKPAALVKGHNESASSLKRRMEDEERLKGTTDEVRVPPEFIRGWEAAEKYYFYLCDLLEESDILSNLDRFGVAALAECLARMEESNKAMAENGDELMITVETKNGFKTVENPYIKTHLKFFDRFRVLSTQYGLSPSSRAQLSALTIEDRSKGTSALEKIINSED